MFLKKKPNGRREDFEDAMNQFRRQARIGCLAVGVAANGAIRFVVQIRTCGGESGFCNHPAKIADKQQLVPSMKFD